VAYQGTGHGHTNTLGDEPGEMGASLPYVDLGPNVVAQQIGAGHQHTCALTRTSTGGGQVKCWGQGVAGNLGNESQTVVCGAPNLTPGDKIAFAGVGVELIDGHSGKKVVLKPATIRGVTSCGMVCSEKELGISDSHEGIMVLPADAPIGGQLSDYLGDVIFDLEVTPNRPDCLSVIGIARTEEIQEGASYHCPPTKEYPVGFHTFRLREFVHESKSGFALNF